MLPAHHRLVDSDAFRVTVRSGHRSGSRTLVVHLDRGDSDAPVRAGFVVSKAVGNAVVRNRVKRRLRHLAAQRLGRLPAGGVLVVRAQPLAATATAAALASDLDTCLAKVTT